MEALREFIAEGVVSIAGDLLKVAFILAAMVIINPRLALITFITIPLFVGATLAFRSSIRAGYRNVRTANGEINVALSETISGIREIHQFTWEKESREAFDRSNTHYLKAYLGIVNAYALFFPAIEIVVNGAMVLILLFAHFAIGVSLHVGEVFAFFAYVNMFFWPLRQLAERFNLFQAAVAATERIFVLLDEKVSIVSPAPREPAAARAAGRGQARRASEVVFDHVNFHYAEGTPILRDISIRIAPGEKVAIVGPTGSGKTTLISLLTRLYDTVSGRILLDGMDLRELPLAELRRAVATVPQDVFLFTGTVAENISLYQPEVDARTVEHASREVLIPVSVPRPFSPGAVPRLGSCACPMALRKKCARRAGASRKASDSSWGWRARSPATPRWSFLTRPPPTSIRKPSILSRTASTDCWKAAPRSSSRTGSPPSARWTASSFSTTARSCRRAATTSLLPATACTASSTRCNPCCSRADAPGQGDGCRARRRMIASTTGCGRSSSTAARRAM